MATLNPYLSFKNNASEALEFYRSALGGEVDVVTFETGGSDVAPEDRSLIMHGHLVTPDGLNLMASDTPSTMPYVAPAGISVSLSSDEEDYLRAAWNALSAGGIITAPLDHAPWGGLFGMFTDKFGISWMIASDDGVDADAVE